MFLIQKIVMMAMVTTFPAILKLQMERIMIVMVILMKVFHAHHPELLNLAERILESAIKESKLVHQATGELVLENRM